MLTPREIIAQSWAITTTSAPLRRWGFFGSFFEMLLDIKLIVYQAYFLWTAIQGDVGGIWDIEIFLYRLLPPVAFWSITAFFLVLLVVELFIPSLSSGAIIGLAAKAHHREPQTGGIVLAVYNFFPILGVHQAFVFTGLSVLITTVSIILRYGAGLTAPLLIVAFIIWIISNILRFFGSFTESAIVVEKMNVFAAGAKSVKLMFGYMHHVVFLFVLLAIISIRIFMNTIIITLVPAIAMSAGVGLTYVLSPGMSFLLAAIAGVVLTVIAAYFFAYLHVFKQAVWTVMYIELIKEKELDQIG